MLYGLLNVMNLYLSFQINIKINVPKGSHLEEKEIMLMRETGNYCLGS